MEISKTKDPNQREGVHHKAERVDICAMKVENLSFAYGKNKILEDVTIELKRGCITTVMGANGSGKSTLFYLMTKNLIQQKGKIVMGDTDIRKMSLQEFALKAAIVHQSNSAPEDLTVEKLVSYGRAPYQRFMSASKKEDGEIIDWAISVTGLDDYRHREIGRLSGGQRQRVWIAMALAQKTDILFLDEPTTFLDIRYQIELLELIKKLNSAYGITIVMVLHDINQAVRYSHRLIGLKDGRIVAEGEPEKIVTPKLMEELYGIRLEVERIGNKMVVMTT